MNIFSDRTRSPKCGRNICKKIAMTIGTPIAKYHLTFSSSKDPTNLDSVSLGRNMLW